jgi:hypothetical protein
MDLFDVLWSKVLLGDGCWEWQATVGNSGYGKIARKIRGSRRNKMLEAHRVSWGLANGPIPSGMLVCHHCDNKKCVRPSHLFLGSDGDNARDCVNKFRNRNQFPALPKEKYASMIEMYNSGLHARLVGEALGVGVYTIRTALKRCGVKMRRGGENRAAARSTGT